MNIIEAYIKFNKQLIILISGINGCGKGEIAQDIASDFEISLIDQFKYYYEDFNEKIKLPNGTTVINWDNDNAVNWENLNKDVNEKKSKGIIIVGVSFPEDKLEFKQDFHLHINIAKKVCYEKRKGFLEKHRDKYPEDVPEQELLKFNKLTFPYYLESREKNKINKWLNANKFSNDELYDQSFDYLITIIQRWLDQKDGKTMPIKHHDTSNMKAELLKDDIIDELADESDEEFDPDKIPNDEPIFIS